MLIKIGFTITLTLIFMFLISFSVCAYGRRIGKTPSELTVVLAACVFLWWLIVFFGSISLAAWIVFCLQ